MDKFKPWVDYTPSPLGQIHRLTEFLTDEDDREMRELIYEDAGRGRVRVGIERALIRLRLKWRRMVNSGQDAVAHETARKREEH